MKKFLLKTTLFAAMMLLLASVVCFMIDKGLQKTEYGQYKEWNALRSPKINADILIQGSSHARKQINPYIVDSILHGNSYNIGIDGYCFDMQHARYKIYLEHNKQPKYLIQTIDIDTWSKSETPFMKEQFLPYLSEKPLKEVLMGNIFSPCYFYFPFIKYFEHFRLSIIGILEYFNLKKFEAIKNYKGYEAVHVSWNNDFEKFKKERRTLKPALDEIVIKQFDDFLADCKKRNSYVIMVCCPQYHEFTDMIEHEKKLNEICEGFSRKYNFSFLDYTNDSLCYDTTYFNNPTHLNAEGSDLFSIKLANDIEKLAVSPKPLH